MPPTGPSVTIALAVGGALEGLAAIAAVAAAGAALVVRDPRARAAAMLAAAAFAALALALLVGDELAGAVGRRPAVAAAAAAVAAAAIVGLGLALRSRPAVFALLVAAALPFRVPVPTGGETASLLVPLYAVIAAGCVAYATAWVRRGPVRGTHDDGHPRRLRLALAAVLVLYGVQSLYSTDVERAVENICFFYVPFALLLLLVLEVRWTPSVLRRVFAVTVALAVVFAIVGIVEYATGHLLISNAKVLEANELKPYFRVNSLFFDPNVFGRYLAVVMVGLAAVLLWSRRPRTAALAGVALAVLWGGLVLSLSQSSFVALLAGLAVLAALRLRPAPVIAAAATAGAVTIAIVLLAPGAVGIESGSERALDRATSGRVDLLQGALRMIADRPLTGFGSGSFAERYRAREGVRSEQAAAISHTTPLTIAAEQGAIGLLPYLALLAAAVAALLRGVAADVRRRPPPLPALGRAVVAAAFLALVLHTFAYAAFLEDPLTWLLLGVGAALAVLRRAAVPAETGRPADVSPVREAAPSAVRLPS